MKKSFDAVEMKREIQQKIRDEYAGVPEEEARRREWAEISADPILGPFIKKARAVKRRTAA